VVDLLTAILGGRRGAANGFRFGIANLDELCNSLLQYDLEGKAKETEVDLAKTKGQIRLDSKMIEALLPREYYVRSAVLLPPSTILDTQILDEPCQLRESEINNFRKASSFDGNKWLQFAEDMHLETGGPLSF
jgi:hypothetical protein